MTKKIKIKGMMCGNCAKHVKDALESINDISAEVDYKSGIAEITFSNETISNEQITTVITNAGYQVKNIK